MTEENFPQKPFVSFDKRPQRLGVVVGGSLEDGLVIELDRQVVIEGVTVGSYVTITGRTGRKFFGMITDTKLESANQAQMISISVESDKLAESYRNALAYRVLHVKPLLVMEADDQKPKPARTVPAKFAIAYLSTADEIALIFPQEQDSYTIGELLDNPGIPIHISLNKLIERSTAVFGRSGTGKTILTLPLLANIIKEDLASVLIFDMRNEYGHTLKGGGDKQFKGLKQLNAISHKVAIAALDPDSSRRRKSGASFELQIGYDQIEPEDIEMLKNAFALTDAQINALHWFYRRFGREWLKKLLSDEKDSGLAELVKQGKLHSDTLNAMRRKLQIFSKFEFVRDAAAQDAVEQIIAHLQQGDSVVVEFGRYGNSQEAYLFVSNFLTRRIHDRYVAMKEAAESSSGEKPRQLVIVIEEARKFLQPGIADLTTFGTIARELCKYNITLLIVEQRPSQIDSEVMSQIGTRIICALSDEHDVAAVLAGVSGASQLRNVLTALDNKQQALIIGHAVPAPVAVRTAEYGEAVYKQFARTEDDLPPEERATLNQIKLNQEGKANALASGAINSLG